jgi:hypothetical protein
VPVAAINFREHRSSIISLPFCSTLLAVPLPQFLGSTLQWPWQCDTYEGGHRQAFFLEFILLGALAICKTRNAYIFKSKQRIFYNCRAIFKKDVYAEK